MRRMLKGTHNILEEIDQISTVTNRLQKEIVIILIRIRIILRKASESFRISIESPRKSQIERLLLETM